MALEKTYTLDERTIDIYLQKSLKFLYPLLNFPNTTTIMPCQTYLAWQGEVGFNEYKLVCVYELKEDYEFKQFEKTVLRMNECFLSFKDAEDNKRVYIFDLKKYRKDIIQFLKGRYFLMSDPSKNTILEFYVRNKYSKEYIDSYLNPENYFERYSSLLNVSESVLRSIGELCDRFNWEKETLCIKKVGVSHKEENLLLF
jgi:hypothetical protein